ncbi:hypothetical protein ACWC10_18345 [Streptomyces sp. NPDC001595]|uniref:hypothetical protein n=1 Tax=Streptomyces sp. NPDC001532 TaxID=3154520 RepID=UPI00332509EA
MGRGEIRRGLRVAWSAWTPAEREAASSGSAAQLPAAFVAWWIGTVTQDDYGLYGGGLGLLCMCALLPVVLPVMGLLQATLHLMPGWMLAEALGRRFPGRPRWARRLAAVTLVGVGWAAVAAVAAGLPFTATALWFAALGVWPVLWAAYVERRAGVTGRSWGCIGLWLAAAFAAVGLGVLTLVGGLLATVTGLVKEYEPPPLSAVRLPGVWRGGDGAVLRLLPGGRAEAVELPAVAAGGWDPVVCRGTRSGTWTTETRDRDGVLVRLGGCGGETFWMIGGTAREPELAVVLGDPDAGDVRILERD